MFRAIFVNFAIYQPFVSMKTTIKHLILGIVALLLCSCTAEESPAAPEPDKDRSYTIICYMSCGGLDYDVTSMLNNLCQVTVPRHINILGIVKWTRGLDFDYSDGSGGVTRFKYNHGQRKLTYSDYAANRFRIDDAQNMANVITWAKEQAPADEYILLLFGHGIAYDLKYDALTRGTLLDDYYKSYTGIDTITQAMELADTHFLMTILNSCMMNTMEYITELVPYTDYYLSSSHVSFTNCDELKLLVEGLMLYGNDDMNAIERSVEYDISREFELHLTSPEYVSDKMLTKCSSVDKFNSAIRSFVDIVVSLYDEQLAIGEEAFGAKYGFTTEHIDEALAASYYFHGVFVESYLNSTSKGDPFYNFDIVDAVSRVAAATQYPELLASAESIKEAADSAVVCRVSSYVEGIDSVYPSVTLVNSEQWTELGFDEAKYESLAFDKATLWSRLLKRNRATYPHSN